MYIWELDTATLCVVVAIALLFLAFRAWQKRKAALSVQSKGTQTDNPVLNIDNTINRLSLELSTLQQQQQSAYSKEEHGSFDQDNVTSFDPSNGSWSSNTNSYPAV